MTDAETAELLAVLQGAYPDADVSEETSWVYEQMLSDLDADEVRVVALTHIATRKWFPRVYELRGPVVRKRLGVVEVDIVLAALRSGATMANIHAQCGDVTATITKHALASCGGTWEMNNTTSPGVWRAQFRKAYEQFKNQAIEMAEEKVVLGLLTPSKEEDVAELPAGERAGDL